MSSSLNVVAHNLSGMFSDRQLGITNGVRAKSIEKLSSGYRINRAADDAAGLSISEKMRRQIRGLTQASENLQDGVSLAQTADGYLAEVHDMIHRINELAIKSANGTMSSSDRNATNEEVQALKKEMQRIFDTAKFNEVLIFKDTSSLEIKGYPNNMQVYHYGNGAAGGLEFNNVRYSIKELQELGLKIDDSGTALESTGISFDLWDGERVSLSMAAGDPLENVIRNYDWSADSTGIYVNNKLAVKWSEMSSGGNGYCFTHHGMEISFAPAAGSDAISTINGDAGNVHESWNVRVGSSVTSQSADIIDETATNMIRVSQSNKDRIDGSYRLIADENGLAIKNTSTGNQTAYVSWPAFHDNALANITDEYGRAIPTNGGYPVTNWGTGSDGNGESDITFDAGATYHFVSPDSGVKIKFDLKLAQSASLSEVMDALNGITLSNQGVNSPGTLTVSGSTSAGAIYAGTDKTIANSFRTQRDYGRNFDIENASMTGKIYVKRDTIAGQPSASDRPDGNGQCSGHTITNSGSSSTTPLSSNETELGTSYYRWTDTSTGTTHYYSVTKYDVDDLSKKSWQATDKWTQRVTYTWDGNLNGHDMNELTSSQNETYSRTLSLSRQVHDTYNLERVTEIHNPDSATLAQMQSVSSYSEILSMDNRRTNASQTQGSITTESAGAATLTRISRSSYNEMIFSSDAGPAFSFDYSVSLQQARYLAGTSGFQEAGSIRFDANGYATRTFKPNENSRSIDEAQFSRVKINVSGKNLSIHSGADSSNKIGMTWRALSLKSIGMKNTGTKTESEALGAIQTAEDALKMISETRSLFGAYQNRFEHAIKLTDNVIENTQHAESIIRDTDMAKEMVRFANVSILAQAGQSMLTQSNQSRDGILKLLQ